VGDFKFGSSWGGWCSNETLEAYGVGLWKNIRRGWEKFLSQYRLMWKMTLKVRFWHDL
jgi:hypothetical protein